MADCKVDGATRYCKTPLASPFQVASKGNKRAMTPAEEAAEEIENVGEADAHRHSNRRVHKDYLLARRPEVTLHIINSGPSVASFTMVSRGQRIRISSMESRPVY
ncbi:hypothetical protein TNCV_250011 [Trichonephila clavipes]|nr:hypothetical protein TNCV_250011 [Trichonephila clavipes]